LRLARLALLAVAALALTACGEKPEQLGASEQRAVTVAFDRPPGPQQVGFHQALAAGHFTEAGLAVELRAPAEQGSPIGQLVSGEADLVTVTGVEVLSARERGTDVVAIAALEQPPADLIDDQNNPVPVGLVLVARGEQVAEAPETLRLFLGALARGTRAAIKDPRPGVEALLDADRKLKSRTLRRAVREALPGLVPRRNELPFGFIDLGHWREYANALRDEGTIGEVPEMGEVATNDLLPGADL